MFGDFGLGRAKVTGAAFINIRTTLQAEDDANTRFAQLQRRQLIKQDNVVQLLDLSRETKRALCSKTYHISAQFEYLETYLKKDLIRRRKTKNPFIELELTRLMYDMVDGYSALQKSGVKMGDINPVLVWLWEDPAMKLPRAKVIERFNLSKDARANLINSVTSGLDLYTDPLVFVSLINNNAKALNEVDNWSRMDVFSMGLVLLEAGLLESIQSIFDANKGVFNHGKLAFFLKKFYMLYGDSSLVSNWVTKMLRADWHQRPDFLDIKAGLPNWYQVKVAIEIGHVDGVGSSKLGVDFGSTDTLRLESASVASYDVSQVTSPPVLVSLTEPRGGPPHGQATTLHTHNDFEFDHKEFVPTPNGTLPPSQQLQSPQSHPFEGSLPDNLPDEHPDPDEPSFDFFNYKDGVLPGVSKPNPFQAYANNGPETGFSALDFNSFKQISTPGALRNGQEGVTGGALPTETYVTEMESDTPRFDKFKEAEVYAQMEESSQFTNQIQNYISPVTQKYPQVPDAMATGGSSGLSLAPNQLLSVINDKPGPDHQTAKHNTVPVHSYQTYVAQTAPTTPEYLNFSVTETDSHLTNQATGHLGRKPTNDFRSGVSDLGFGNSTTSAQPETKMNLSNYLKNMR
jgi:hypothetical protein